MKPSSDESAETKPAPEKAPKGGEWLPVNGQQPKYHQPCEVKRPGETERPRVVRKPEGWYAIGEDGQPGGVISFEPTDFRLLPF